MACSSFSEQCVSALSKGNLFTSWHAELVAWDRNPWVLRELSATKMGRLESSEPVAKCTFTSPACCLLLKILLRLIPKILSKATALVRSPTNV